MPFSHLPAVVSAWFSELTSALDRRSAARVLLLLGGALFARGRRTVTSWFRPAGITEQYRPAYHALAAAGRRSAALAARLLCAVVKPLLRRHPGDRLLFGLDDTPTPRYGPWVQAAGIHHNPSPGPAGEQHVYGHVWVSLAWLARHPLWQTLALPVRALLYVRAQDVPALAQVQPWTFRTKLELAVELVRWLTVWLGATGKALWLVADGAYAKQPLLGPVTALGWVVVSRLRKDAALRSVPVPPRPGQPKPRGPKPTYGKARISLAKRAGQQRGWQVVTCVQYGQEVVKTIKTFEATWQPARGRIRVVLVRECDGWVAFFCTDPSATAVQILEAMADRGALEQTFKDVKEVWGAGQQQVRNVYASIGAFALNLSLYTVVEAWAWARTAAELVDRSWAPWDTAERRPSHADKRKALQRETLREEIQAALGEQAKAEGFQEIVTRLLNLAT